MPKTPNAKKPNGAVGKGAPTPKGIAAIARDYNAHLQRAVLPIVFALDGPL